MNKHTHAEKTTESNQKASSQPGNSLQSMETVGPLAASDHRGRMMQLQSTIGNHAMGRLLANVQLSPLRLQAKEDEEKGVCSNCAQSKLLGNLENQEEDTKNVCSVQPKLSLGEPDDIYEQEADRVSEQVSGFAEAFNTGNVGGMESSTLSQVSVPRLAGLAEISPKHFQNATGGGRKQRVFPNMVQKKGENSTVTPEIETRIQQSRGMGQPLPDHVHNAMALQTGYDFSNVRVKTDSEASELNRSINARAFTLGNDIWLGKNESPNDIRLMAHELTHVVQQGAARPVRVSPSPLVTLQGKSLVKEYLQSLAKGGNHDPSLYRAEIKRFETTNPPDQIGELHRQILEKPQISNISQTANSTTLRACGGDKGSAASAKREARVKSGPKYTPSGSIKASPPGTPGKSASFDMTCEFEHDPSNGINASYGEVRQYIKWDKEIPNNPGFSPARNFNLNTWYEDRDSVGKRYGHRTGPYSECVSINHYEDSTGTKDCANGAIFKGQDAPKDGSGTKTGKWFFKLVAVDTANGDKEIGGSDTVTVEWA